METNNVTDSAGARSQKPSMCRVVVYNHSGSADGKYPPMQSPAIIMKVWDDGSCDLFVMSNRATRDAGNGSYFAHDIKHVSEVEPGKTSWSWPERV